MKCGLKLTNFRCILILKQITTLVSTGSLLAAISLLSACSAGFQVSSALNAVNATSSIPATSGSPTPTPSATPTVTPTPTPTPSAPVTTSLSWSQVNSYAIQYNNVSLTALAASPYKMLILDRGDSNGNDWTKSALAPVAQSHVLAGYIDGTHAENWRAYWTSASAPYIIGSTSYSGEYYADLKNTAWLSIMTSYIDALAAQGFTAIFIDNCDAYNDSKFANFYGSQAAGEQATLQFLQTLRNYAFSKYNMRLIANNGLELITLTGYSQAVDAVMYEDIFNGQSASNITDVTSSLNHAVSMNLLVLDAEVTSSLTTAQSLVQTAAGDHYLPYVTTDENYGTLGFAGQASGVVAGEIP